jgi:hypothetical protein
MFDKPLLFIGKDIALEINVLTNQTGFLTKLARKKNLSKKEVCNILKTISHPAIVDCATEAIEFLEENELEELRKEAYELYLIRIVEFTQSRQSEDVLLVKLADRLDNTLSDLPGKFNNIMKLYDKNEFDSFDVDNKKFVKYEYENNFFVVFPLQKQKQKPLKRICKKFISSALIRMQKALNLKTEEMILKLPVNVLQTHRVLMNTALK